MLLASGSPELAAESNTRTIREGDVQIDPNKQAPAPPPTLRNPGEKLPTDNQTTGVMRPVQFPKPHPDEMPGANPDEQSSTPPAASQQPVQPQPSNPPVFTNIPGQQLAAGSHPPRQEPPAPAAARQPQPAPANAPPAASPSN